MSQLLPQSPVVVCSNLVIDDDRLLLVRETKPIALGRWSPPGGKLEPGETLRQGAEREANEETGLVVEAGPLIGIYHCLETLEGGASLNFVFSSAVIGGEIRTTSEHPEVAFVPFEELVTMFATKRVRGSHVELALASILAGEEMPHDVVSIVPASEPPTV